MPVSTGSSPATTGARTGLRTGASGLSAGTGIVLPVLTVPGTLIRMKSTAPATVVLLTVGLVVGSSSRPCAGAPMNTSATPRLSCRPSPPSTCSLVRTVPLMRSTSSESATGLPSLSMKP